MTTDEIRQFVAECRERCEILPKEKWFVVEYAELDDNGNGPVFLQIGPYENDDCDIFAYSQQLDYRMMNAEIEKKFEFIAAARTDLPAALDIIEEDERKIAELEARIEELLKEPHNQRKELG